MRVLAAVLAVINVLVLWDTLPELLNYGDESSLFLLFTNLLIFVNLLLAVQIVRVKTGLVRPALIIDAVIVGLCLLDFILTTLEQGASEPNQEILVGCLFLAAHMVPAIWLLAWKKRAARIIDTAAPVLNEPTREYLNSTWSEGPNAPGLIRVSHGPYQKPNPESAYIKDFVGLRSSLAELFTRHGYQLKPQADEYIKFFTLAALTASNIWTYGLNKSKSDSRLLKLTDIFAPPPDASATREETAKYQRLYLDTLKAIEADFSDLQSRRRPGESYEDLKKKNVWFKSWSAIYLTVTEPLPFEPEVKDRRQDRSEILYDEFKDWMRAIGSYWQVKDREDGDPTQPST